MRKEGSKEARHPPHSLSNGAAAKLDRFNPLIAMTFRKIYPLLNPLSNGAAVTPPPHGQSTGPLDDPHRRKCVNSKDLQVAHPVDRPLATGPLD